MRNKYDSVLSLMSILTHQPKKMWLCFWQVLVFPKSVSGRRVALLYPGPALTFSLTERLHTFDFPVQCFFSSFSTQFTESCRSRLFSGSRRDLERAIGLETHPSRSDLGAEVYRLDRLDRAPCTITHSSLEAAVPDSSAICGVWHICWTVILAINKS